MRLIVLLTFASTAGASSAAETITYSYDAKGRIISVAHSGTVNNGVVQTYGFDKADNRTKVQTVGGASRVIVVPLNGLSVIPINIP